MHALDQRTGKERWHFAIGDTNNTAFGRIESSAAVVKVGATRVVLFGGGATMYALDGATGAQLTSVCLDPRSNPAVRCQGASNGAIEILSSPAVVKVGDELRVLVGMDVHNASNVGRTGVLSFRLLERAVAARAHVEVRSRDPRHLHGRRPAHAGIGPR